MKYYETPLGRIEIDSESIIIYIKKTAINKIINNNQKLKFELTDKDAEEEEFSMEI